MSMKCPCGQTREARENSEERGLGACRWSTETVVSRDGDVASLCLRKCPVNRGACVQFSRTAVSRWRGKPGQDGYEVVVPYCPCKADDKIQRTAVIQSCSESVARVDERQHLHHTLYQHHLSVPHHLSPLISHGCLRLRPPAPMKPV